VEKVLAVTVHKDAAVVAHILRVSAAAVRVEKNVRYVPQDLHRRLGEVASDVELDESFLLRLVCLHGLDLLMQVGSLLCYLGKPLGALLSDLGDRILEHVRAVATSPVTAALSAARGSLSRSFSRKSNIIPKVSARRGRNGRGMHADA
jgi:hypothetical protein